MGYCMCSLQDELDLGDLLQQHLPKLIASRKHLSINKTVFDLSGMSY